MRTFVPEKSGTAAVEFALIASFLLLVFGGLADYSLLLWAKNRLAASVAQGMQYAFSAGPGVAAADIQNVIQQAGSLTPANVTVTGPACYCVGGAPASLTAQTCGKVCPDSTMPGEYVLISASYQYQPLLPLISKLTGTMITESTTERLQ